MSTDHEDIPKMKADIETMKTDIHALKKADMVLAAKDKELEQHAHFMEQKLSELRAMIGETASREDMLKLKSHFDESINNLLRDALNAFPAKYAVGLTFLLVLFGAADYLIAHGFHF